MKGVLFVNGGYTKGLTREKWNINRKGLDRGAKPPRIKIC